MKKKVRYNPIIRYLLLNSLKFNFSAFSVIKKYNESSVGSIVVAVLILVIINVTPIFLSRILYKNSRTLDIKEQHEKIGTLYLGRNVS